MLYRRLLRPYLLQEQSLIDRTMARASDELQAVVDRGREVGARTVAAATVAAAAAATVHGQ